MANWSLLSEYLRQAEARVRLSFDELAQIVGELPASASLHRAWWSGDRPHVRAWRETGYTISELVMGREVTFVGTPTATASPRDVEAQSARRTTGSACNLPQAVPGRPDILLVTCVRSKLARPAAAKDLYVSDLFKKQRDYAEQSGLPWYILSAEHGLVRPDEWLAPYERYLPDTPQPYRAAWGNWVTERLDLLEQGLIDKTIEVHASAAYVDEVRPRLEAKGATVLTPLRGLAQGHRLAWYNTNTPTRLGDDHSPGDGFTAPAPEEAHADAQAFVARLSDESAALAPAALLVDNSGELDQPGLYSWWVDQEGAHQLSAGLGTSVSPGLIYAGLAGATRWPSGRRSTNTLLSRIRGMHLGGRHEFSTFRRSLGSILAALRQETTIDEEALTCWMHEHLRVIALPYPDPDTLGRLEREVLSTLDPALNLSGMAPTPVRRRLTELRRNHR